MIEKIFDEIVSIAPGVAIVSAVIGTIAGVITIRNTMQNSDTPRRVSWRRVEWIAREIIDAIQKDDFRPDVIVSVGRAGAILSGMLSGNIDGKKVPLIGLDVGYDWQGPLRSDFIHWAKELDLNGTKVLIAVGEVHTGNTLRMTYEAIQSYGPSEIKTAAFFRFRTTAFFPDYYGRVIRRNVRMPWHFARNYQKANLPPDK